MSVGFSAVEAPALRLTTVAASLAGNKKTPKTLFSASVVNASVKAITLSF
jgi:hypothetical protein